MRTDRTFVCTGCRVRSWPVRRSPACGETRYLGDLEQAPLAELERRVSAPSGDWVGGTLVGGGALGIFGTVLLFSSGLVGPAEIALGSSLVSIVLGLVRKPKRTASAREPYRLLESPIARAKMPRSTHRGRVRARGTLISPLTGRPCVAWRLVGGSGSMPLDDGRALPFTVLTGRDEVEVDAQVATLELAVPDGEPRPLRAEPVPLDPELGGWLAARGIDPTGALLARESILAEDDEVEVVGTPTTETRADGYRGHSRREVLADLPGSPLIVRSGGRSG